VVAKDKRNVLSAGKLKIVDALVAGGFRLMGGIPPDCARTIGNRLGDMWFAFDRSRRRVALESLQQVFGAQRSASEIRSLARRVFRNLSRIIFEVSWAMQMDEKRFRRYVTICGLHHYRQAIARKRGVLLMTAHCGNWELLTLVAAITRHPVGIVYRPFDFKPLDRFFRAFRSRFGAQMIPAAHAMRKIMRKLRNGDAVAILFDQNVDWYEGVFVDFFGRRACTNKGLALLALQTGAPVVPVFMRRVARGFVAEIGPEVPLARSGDKIRDIETHMRRCNQVLEDFVRRYPDQWFWVHRRWKTKPYHAWPPNDCST